MSTDTTDVTDAGDTGPAQATDQTGSDGNGWIGPGSLPVLQSLLFNNDRPNQANVSYVSPFGETSGPVDQSNPTEMDVSAYQDQSSAFGQNSSAAFMDPTTAAPNWMQINRTERLSESSSAGGAYFDDGASNEYDSNASQNITFSFADSSTNDAVSSLMNSAGSSAVLSKSTPPSLCKSPESGLDKDFQQRKSASDRERSRMKDMNRAFDMLRGKLAHRKPPGKRLSKIQALRFAIQYIADLEDLLSMGTSPDHDPNYDAYYYWAQAKGYSYAKEKTHTETSSPMVNMDAASFMPQFDVQLPSSSMVIPQTGHVQHPAHPPPPQPDIDHQITSTTDLFTEAFRNQQQQQQPYNQAQAPYYEENNRQYF